VSIVLPLGSATPVRGFSAAGDALAEGTGGINKLTNLYSFCFILVGLFFWNTLDFYQYDLAYILFVDLPFGSDRVFGKDRHNTSELRLCTDGDCFVILYQEFEERLLFHSYRKRRWLCQEFFKLPSCCRRPTTIPGSIPR